jgi:hypothetical protein
MATLGTGAALPGPGLDKLIELYPDLIRSE